MPSKLVTDAAGFIGSQLTEARLDRGVAAIAVDALVIGRRANLHGDMNTEAFQ
jgi:nucleoside-diphosphate-sugar epimerase